MHALSVLDLSPVTTGGSGPIALRNSLDLARLAGGLGYTRYWVAEHHNLPSVASSAPDIMIGQIAAVTERIRVGAGGIMLPNHAPLNVVERFHMLEALFPGRIDLGIGRAPGTDQVTSLALRRRQDIRDDDDFLERFQELMLLESRGFPQGHPFRNVRAMPADVALPPIHLLGSSGYSAELAATIGAGFAFAHHFATHNAVEAMTGYRSRFRPPGGAGPAPGDPRLRRGVRRHPSRGRPPRHHHRSQFPAPFEGRIPAAREPRGGRGTVEQKRASRSWPLPVTAMGPNPRPGLAHEAASLRTSAARQSGHTDWDFLG